MLSFAGWGRTRPRHVCKIPKRCFLHRISDFATFIFNLNFFHLISFVAREMQEKVRETHARTEKRPAEKREKERERKRERERGRLRHTSRHVNEKKTRHGTYNKLAAALATEPRRNKVRRGKRKEEFGFLITAERKRGRREEKRARVLG